MGDDVLEGFGAYLCSVRGLSAKTARNYVQAARALLSWLERTRPGGSRWWEGQPPAGGVGGAGPRATSSASLSRCAAA